MYFFYALCHVRFDRQRLHNNEISFASIFNNDMDFKSKNKMEFFFEFLLSILSQLFETT